MDNMRAPFALKFNARHDHLTTSFVTSKDEAEGEGVAEHEEIRLVFIRDIEGLHVIRQCLEFCCCLDNNKLAVAEVLRVCVAASMVATDMNVPIG